MPKKILVIEDSLDSRELIHLHLTTEGYTVILASNGREVDMILGYDALVGMQADFSGIRAA